MDRVVDDLAYTLGFGRMDLNIVRRSGFLIAYLWALNFLLTCVQVAAGKGLISGPVVIHLRHESAALNASTGSNV